MNAVSDRQPVVGERYEFGRPISISLVILAMMPLVIMPLLSVFIFGIKGGPIHFWDVLTSSEALFSIKLSLLTSSAATVCNLIFGLLAAYVLTKYDFAGSSALMITISLPTAIPTAVAGFALLLLWGPQGLLGKYIDQYTDFEVMFTTAAIILANIFVTFPLAFGVIKPALDNFDRSYEDAAETMGASRLQTFFYVVLPSLRGALVTGALLTFARSIGEFGSTIMVSGNTPLKTQTAPLFIYSRFQDGDVEGANAIAVVLAIISFAVFSLIIVFRNRLER